MGVAAGQRMHQPADVAVHQLSMEKVELYEDVRAIDGLDQFGCLVLAGKQIMRLNLWAERFNQHLDAVLGEAVCGIANIIDKGIAIALPVRSRGTTPAITCTLGQFSAMA